MAGKVRMRAEMGALRRLDYFHYEMPPSVVEALLRHDGDFIVRAPPTEEAYVILDVFSGNRVHHLRLFADGQPQKPFYATKSTTFKSVEDLLDYYWKGRRELGPTTGATAGTTGTGVKLSLRQPISRTRWQVSAENVKLGEIFDTELGLMTGKFRKGGTEAWTGSSVKVARGLDAAGRQTEAADFQKEAWLYVRVGTVASHSNVVACYGVSLTEPRMVVSEWMGQGNLRDLIRSAAAVGRPITQRRLNCFARDTAQGLAFLNSLGIVIRDLRARAVFVNDKDVAKITKFDACRSVRPNYEIKVWLCLFIPPPSLLQL